MHALRDCTTSHEVLSIGGWEMSITSKKYNSCIGWLENMMRILDKRVMPDLLTTLWNCWNSRNNLIFKGKEDKVQTIWDRASNLGKEFLICILFREPLVSPDSAAKKWEKPPKGFVKINFDATVGVNRMGYRVIVWEDDGFILDGRGLY
ncbi:hypothetical protein Goarm_009936 [Gossypium armourianum]|uniref:Uncharacterized protein n=1 Tax=Gossypium armourianum TaxID=34283 RepID=A0A7J9JUF6_9ROSI|nr:hypothetical protein [Gossypium armourianum]